jgi:hypothetical protein
MVWMIKGMIKCLPTDNRMAGRPGLGPRAPGAIVAGRGNSRIARMSTRADQDARMRLPVRPV